LLFILNLHLIPNVLSLGKWQQLVNSNQPPTGRESGGLGVINDIVYFFGGLRHCDGSGLVCGTDPCNNVFYNQLDKYDLSTHLWSVNITGHLSTVPAPRSFFAYTTDQDRDTLLVYGGATFQGSSVASCDNVFYDGLWEYSVSTGLWVLLDSPTDPNSPKARADPSIVVYNNLVYLFGGLKSPGILKNDLLTFDYTTGLWSVVSVSGAALPAGRYHQRMLLDKSRVGSNDRLIVVWGDNFLSASIPPPVYINDIWDFDLTTHQWSLLDSGNQRALYHPIAGHYKKILYVAYGDLRPKPYEVEFEDSNGTEAEVEPECFDEITGFESTPTDLHYVLNVEDANGYSRALQSINVISSLGSSKMNAHAPYKEKFIYAFGGFNFYCPKFVPVGNRTAVTTYVSNVYVTDLSDFNDYIR